MSISTRSIGPEKLICLVIFQLVLSRTVLSGNVLIWPTEGSHWLNVKVIIKELINRGHNVTVLVSSASPYVNPKNTTSALHYEVFQVPFDKVYMHSIIDGMVNLWVYEKPEMSFWQFYKRLSVWAGKMNHVNRHICDAVLKNKDLMQQLERRKIDVVLSDPIFLCGDLVAISLGVPYLYSLRFTPGSTVERNCAQMPTPPSYVPAVLSEMGDTMSLMERMWNIVLYTLQDLIFQSLYGHWDQYYSQILGKPTTFCEIMGKAEIWLIRTYWDFEYPRPFLPNFEFVGGLHCQPAKPLPEDMEKFVQSSGEHGIVVFSLGSMVKNLSIEKANIIGTALSKIPQKVLWRYSGKTPETLGPNTKLYDWLPQNDLLGHPKTKAFIAHGGTNGIYEAIYHGIPMVGIPLFVDQPDNMAHMKAKGMAVVLNFNTFEAQDLVDALNTVINNPIYKENAMKLSQIQHDQPIKPLDRAVFWIEFVMRHKGAKHLRPASHHLTWYQYHCLDIIALLILCLVVFLIVSIKCCSFCFGKRKRVVKKKRE